MGKFGILRKNIYLCTERNNDMGNIKSSAQLQQMFRLSRERKQQEKEEKKRQRQLQYKELCHQADLLLKKAQEEENMRRMEQLQALAKQTPQKAQKCPHMTHGTPFYGTSLIEDSLFDYVTVQTRQEIQAMEETEGGKINWDKWDEVVNSTRQSIRNMGVYLPDYKEATPRKDRRSCVTYVYDLQLNLLGEFPTARKAEDAFGITRNTSNWYRANNKPYRGYIFRDRPL